ncbi:MAG: DUF3168 domain-containing protein [Rhizobiaceae bacterium]|nr:DUF3168 domain-containing protein [Rhizobiaceae bacterium]MCV0405482.1 DUF3168 domain-containing protein [Rhizobiaceae bacterium]
MTAPATDLQKSVFATLDGDTELSGLLGGQRVYDRVPPGSAFPYITFGRTALYDWSTGTEIGTEHIFTLQVWSKARGREETQAIMERVRALLHDRPLPMESHRLVNLRLEFAEDRQDDDLAVHRGLLRFRATVEAVNGE